MQAEDRGAGGGAAGGEAEASPGDLGSSDSPEGPQDPRIGDIRETGTSPSRGPPITRARRGPGPGGDAAPWPGCFAGSTAGSPERLLFHCTIRVPFPSAGQAETARQFLAPRVQPYPGAVLRQLLVSANFLIIRLTAEDFDQLQIAVNSCLHQLCILIWTIVNILRPVLFPKPSVEKGGSI